MSPVTRTVSIIALVGCLLLVALYLTGRIGKSDRIPDRSFDPVEWKIGDRRTRGAMVDDLENRSLLIGKNKTAIIALLGMPDASDTTGFFWDYAVDIGRRTGPWGLGGTWLFYTSVRFDTLSATVVEVYTRD